MLVRVTSRDVEVDLRGILAVGCEGEVVEVDTWTVGAEGDPEDEGDYAEDEEEREEDYADCFGDTCRE